MSFRWFVGLLASLGGHATRIKISNEKDFTTTLTKFSNNTTHRINDVKHSQNEFQTSMNEAIVTAAQPTEQDNKLNERVGRLEAAMELMNLDELKQDLCKMSDDMSIDSASVLVMEKNISKLQKEVIDIANEVSATDKDLGSWKTVCEGRNKESRERYKHFTRTHEKHEEAILKICERFAEVNGQYNESKYKEMAEMNGSMLEGKESVEIQLSDSILIEDGVEMNGSSEPEVNEDKRTHINGPDLALNVMDGNDLELNEMNGDDEMDLISQGEKPQENPTEDESTELIFLIDSNGRYFDYRRLWTMKGTQFRRCYTMDDVEKLWNGMERLKRLKYFFISDGTNDLEKDTTHQLFTKISKFVQRVWDRYPEVKFILSEVTPRTDYIDARVKETNVLLQQFAQSYDAIFLTKNSNLRDSRNFFPDGKHLKHDIIPLFVSNIKRALRAAYGMKKERSYESKDWTNRNQLTREQPRSMEIKQPNVKDLQRELLQMLTRAFGYFGT